MAISTNIGVSGGETLAQTKGLDAKTPLLLLPINIQTRFVDPVKDRPELWVRIYPDQIAVNSHEPELTEPEATDGQAYWNVIWQVGNPPSDLDQIKAPWRTLASRYGPQRAAWIALTMTPTNLSQQPTASTPDGILPVPAPTFPLPSKRNSSWEKPALADALPDAWTVVLVSGTKTQQFQGNSISLPLAVSLTPSNGGSFPPGVILDAGLQWMLDFEAAYQAGMALKIPITPQERESGFDQILVYGLRGNDANPGQTFANLLSAHHFTDGLAFVPQGAPTNNTPDASAAYSRKDANYEFSFQTDRQSPLTANPNCDGIAFASLVGIPSSIFDHAGYADNTDALNSADMLQVLWPATLGYFLSQMMADVFSPDVIEGARQYVLTNARPRGPIPALRVGRIPYGVLPVTSLRNYNRTVDMAGAVEPELVNFILKLLPTWVASSSKAPHMQRGGDTGQNFMSVLGMDASSMTFQGRQVLGNTFLWNLSKLNNKPQSFQGQWWQNFAAPARQLLDSLGYNQWNPRFLDLGFDEKSFPVGFSTVQDGALSETTALNADAAMGGGQTGNYITWLQTASVADVQSENYPGPKPTSLLYKILRQSLLLLYANLAGLAEVSAGTLTLAQLRENEIFATQPSLTTLTPWQVLTRPSIPNPGLIWADYLMATNFPNMSAFGQLNDFRASLGRLAVLPTAELDRLLTETLDACSHRLDVWSTAIATALLKETRANQNGTVSLGCYGWVEDVRPETGRLPVDGPELQQVRELDGRRIQKVPTLVQPPVPLQPLADNGGFIYAPSQTQAAVAALLRNGYMTHKNTAEEGLLSIDLSSERVQKALWLIKGAQQGQSLNFMLGSLFEDALHDQNLDRYVQSFRNAYPMVGSKLTPSSAPSETIAASNIVDGLKLRTAWDNGQLPTGQIWGNGLPGPGPGQGQDTVIAILKMLDDYADALGDVSISEAVFQMIRGNFGRGGGLMDAISRGSRPPDPDVVNTPRGGIDLTHRVAVLLAGSPAPSPAWSGVTQHPRAAAEPWLDAWLGALLPDPATVRCQVQYQDTSGPVTKTISLSDLNVGPLDLLAMSDAAEVPQNSELEQRIYYSAALPLTATNVKIAFQPNTLPAGSIFFTDVLYLAQKLRSLIGAGRPLRPQDMTLPETDAAGAGGTVNLTDLQSRANATMQSLFADIGALTNALPGLAVNPDAVRAALLQCSFYGITGAIPNTNTGLDSSLGDQATRVITILQSRYLKASTVLQASAADLSTVQATDIENVFKTIFGNDFVVLPQFKPPNLTALQIAFGQSASLITSDPQAPLRWLRQLTHVRPGISRLDMALSTAQALCGGMLYPPSLMLGQLPPPLPPPIQDRWLGLPLDPANPPQKGRVAWACVTAGDPTSQGTYAGLLVDEWPERIPSAQETASVAFHFEEPSARAPQAMLLAVCPDNRKTWEDQILQAVLQETLELAKIRAVDLASVEQVGQILPALYFALNLQGATVSTQFAILKESIRATQINS